MFHPMYGMQRQGAVFSGVNKKMHNAKGRKYMSEHFHIHDKEPDGSEHVHGRDHHGRKKQLFSKIKDTPGLIYIERQIQDDAIVISGSLSVRFESADLDACVAECLEVAAREIRERSGIVGHIKTSASTSSTSMISVTDEEAMIKYSPIRRARITLAAIVFMIDPLDAENIIRKSLSDIRARLRPKK